MQENQNERFDVRSRHQSAQPPARPGDQGPTDGATRFVSYIYISRGVLLETEESRLFKKLPIFDMAIFGEVHDLTTEFNFEWKIVDFFSLPEKDGKGCFSPEFSFAGESWSFALYPNGRSVTNSIGYIEVYLHKKWDGPPVSLAWSFGVKTFEGKKEKEIQLTYVFEKAQGVGTPKFLKRSELSEKKSELVPSNVLTLVCHIEHHSKSSDDADNTVTVKCSHCKGTLVTECAPSHEQKCLHKPIQCPTCSDVVALREWSGHECETARLKVSDINLSEDYGFVNDINQSLKENTGIDLTFELETPSGKTKLFAHQLILSVMSAYFADEFYDQGKNKGHKVIPLKGINPKAFEQMIRYCYGETPSLQTTEEARILFKIASKFKVISLQNLCHTFFRNTKIDVGNVFSILEISEEMGDKSLGDMCHKILEEKTREVKASYELRDVTPAMMYTILDLPKLSLNSEYELIKWLFDWAKVKFEYSYSENAREYLEKLLQDLNFLALTLEEFAMLCKDNPEFFSSDEIASVSLNIAFRGTREMPDWYDRDLKCRVYTGSN